MVTPLTQPESTAPLGWRDPEYWNQRYNITRGGEIVALANQIRGHDFKLGPVSPDLQRVISDLGYTMRWPQESMRLVPVVAIRSRLQHLHEQYLKQLPGITGLPPRYDNQEDPLVEEIRALLTSEQHVGSNGTAIWQRAIHRLMQPYAQDSTWLSDELKRISSQNGHSHFRGPQRYSASQDAYKVLHEDGDRPRSFTVDELLAKVHGAAQHTMTVVIKAFETYLFAMAEGDLVTESTMKGLLGILLQGNFPVNVLLENQSFLGGSRQARTVVVLVSTT